MECFVCQQKIKPQNGRHIYFCANKNELNLDRKEIKFKQICFITKYNFTKSEMEDLYLVKKYSLPDFKKEYELNYNQTIFLLDYFKIKKRDIGTSNALDSRAKKYKKTCIKKYGVDNVSKVKSIKDKKKETFIKNYGVDNIWKSKEYYQWLHNYMKTKYGKKSLPNRYGNTQKYWDGKTKEEKLQRVKAMNDGYKRYWKALTDEQKNEIIQKRCKNLSYFFKSKLETRVSKALMWLNISYVWQFWINRKSYDFKINKSKIIIEVNGDYWHANPLLYKKEDAINYPGGYKLASEIWKRDDKKRLNAEKYGYHIIYIWESEINILDDVEIIDFLTEKIK